MSTTEPKRRTWTGPVVLTVAAMISSPPIQTTHWVPKRSSKLGTTDAAGKALIGEGNARAALRL